MQVTYTDAGTPVIDRTPEEYDAIRRENPNVGTQTLQGRQLFAAGSPCSTTPINARVTEKCVTEAVAKRLRGAAGDVAVGFGGRNDAGIVALVGVGGPG